jgi:outer membrane protein TolC
MRSPTFAIVLALTFALLQTLAAAASSTLGDIYQVIRTEAMSRAPNLKIAREESDQKSAATWTAWTRWLPRADLSLTQSQSQDYSIVTSGALSGTPFNFEPAQVNLNRWTLIASLPLYNRSVHLGVEQAHAEARRSRARLETLEGEFESRLKSAFGQVLAEEYALLSISGSIETSKKSLSEAQLRFSLGQKTRLDVLRAEADLSALESRRLTTLEQRAGAVKTLSELTGISRQELEKSGLILSRLDARSLDTERTLRAEIEDLTLVGPLLARLEPFLGREEDQEVISRIETRLTGNHPRNTQIKAEEDLSAVRGGLAWAEEWPELRIQANLNKQAGTWSEALDPDQRSYSVQATLTIPVFSFGSSISRFRERNSIQDAGETQARVSALELRNNILNDRTRILTLIQAEKAQKLAIRQNEELTELSFKSYQLGRAGILELLSAQNAAMEARTQWVRTRIQLSALVTNFAWNLLAAPERTF